MLKTFVTATAISGLMLSGAFAQTTPQTPPASSPAPSATPAPSTTPATPAPSAGAEKAGSGQFVAAQKSDQWLASKFNGTDVLGPNNEKIGDVNDILFDKSGKIMAVVVGVGGFLGIGEKDVALDMQAFQMVPASAAGNTGTTGTTTTSGTPDPNNMKLKVSMTKDQLKQAPSFERYKAASTTTGSGTGAGTGSRPATPAR